MVVGKERVLRAAKPVKLADTRRVKVGSRRCTVSGRTPLGVLAATSLAIRLRDYGSCGRRPADAASLFVTRSPAIATAARTAGSTRSAARSPRPARATAPAAACARVTGCCGSTAARSAAGGCQRTLEATPDRTTAAPGETVRVTVRGYDDGPRRRGPRRDGDARHRDRDDRCRRRRARSPCRPPAGSRSAPPAPAWSPPSRGRSAPDEARPRRRLRPRRARRGRIRLRPRARGGDGERGLADRHARLRRGADRPQARWPA